MNLPESIILGIIEGITEFLPISSTGHLILSARVLNIPKTDFLKSFEIVIQLGAVLAVIWLYWRTLLTKFETIKKILLAFIPTGIGGLIFYKLVKNLLGSEMTVLWTMLSGGVFLIIFEMINKKRKEPETKAESISYNQAFVIGLAQMVSIIPGVSRAAATIIGGLMLGINKKAAVEFSFLLAVPTMAAAAGFDLIKNFGALTAGGNLDTLVIGFVVSFLAAFASIKFLLNYIKRHSLIVFGIYRVLLSALFWIF